MGTVFQLGPTDKVCNVIPRLFPLRQEPWYKVGYALIYGNTVMVLFKNIRSGPFNHGKVLVLSLQNTQSFFFSALST